MFISCVNFGSYHMGSHIITLLQYMHRMNFHDDSMLEVPRPDLHGSVHFV